MAWAGGNNGDDLDHETDSFLQSTVDREREQDEALDALQGHLSRVKNISHSLSNSLGEQLGELTRFGEDLENSQSSIDELNRRTAALIRESGGPKTFCFILALALIAFVLFLLVLYS